MSPFFQISMIQSLKNIVNLNWQKKTNKLYNNRTGLDSASRKKLRLDRTQKKVWIGFGFRTQ